MNVAAASSPSSRKQKRLGPAPIASMEDTTTEEREKMEYQNNHSLQRWSQEKSSIDSTRGSPTKAFDCPAALTPATPRIDISRASSHSSHHDSRDSSPENVFEQVGTGTLQDSGVLGFREEDTLDLRNSTEELQFMEPEKGHREKEKPNTQIVYGSSPSQRYSPIIWKLDDQSTTLGQQQQQQQQQPQQHQYQQQQQQPHNRKDSASSEVVAFLSISGRTSRLSSVGSQGSATSKLSATSAVSGISRSPSPHKMLLETSFCGVKPLLSYPEGSIGGCSLEPSTEKMLEQVILSRKQDPTEAVLAEGVQLQPLGAAADGELQHPRRGPAQNLPQQPPPGGGGGGNEAPEESGTGGGHMRRKSDCGAGTTSSLEVQHLKVSQTSRSVGNKRHIPPRDLKNSIVGVMPSGTEYIRIKLKPDHCYTDNGIADNERVVELSKENGGQELAAGDGQPRTRASSITRSASPANQQQPQHQPRKKRTSTASNDSGAGGQPADHHSVSANSTPSKQKLVLKMFKSKRDPKSKSPSPMGSAADGIGGGGGGVGAGDHYTTSNMAAARSPGTTGLRYYDAPLDGQSIHIPLHTPPEERRLGSFRSAIGVASSPLTDKEGAGGASVAPLSVSASATPTGHSSHQHAKYAKSSGGGGGGGAPKQQRIANMTVTIHDRPKPMPPLKCYRIDNPDGSIIIPLKSPVEDKEPSSHNWENVIGELSQRIEKQVSEDRDDADPVVGKPSAKSAPATRRPASLLYNDVEPSGCPEGQHAPRQQQLQQAASGPPPPPPPPPPPATAGSKPRAKTPQAAPPEAMSGKRSTTTTTTTTAELHQQAAASVSSAVRHKQQTMFQMRVGSGSEEQIFSTALKDYSKEMHRNGSSVSQSSEGSQHQAGAGGGASGAGDVAPRKPFAGNCSDHPNDLETADSVTTSSSSPQQVMMAQGAMLMKELHEHQKQYQQRQQQQQKQLQQQQQQQQLAGAADSTEAAAAVGSRSSSPAECASSDVKHHHHHQYQHHQHHYHNHRPKHHKHDRRSSSTDRPTASSVPAEDGVVSSESEKDSEVDSASTTTTAAAASAAAGRHALRPNMLAIEDHESAGLVFQESFDDELPYIPTTLPEEKPMGVKLVPVKERSQIDLKTYPLERPRSTTPIHPGALEKYCDRAAAPGGRTLTSRGSVGERSVASQLPDRAAPGVAGEKLRISLPAKRATDQGPAGSGAGGGAVRMFEHRSSVGAITMTTTTAGGGSAASGICTATSTGTGTGRQYRSTSTTLPASMGFTGAAKSRGIVLEDTPTPPPLPPRKASASSASATPPGHKWIDVEAIPEMRKAPKRITAIPQKQTQHQHQHQQQQPQQQQHQPQSSHARNDSVGTLDRQDTGPDGQLYNYVNPEDCQCECHEHERTAASTSTNLSAVEQHAGDMMALSAELADDCRPLLRSSSSSSTAAAPSSTPVAHDRQTDREQDSVGFASTNDL